MMFSTSILMLLTLSISASGAMAENGLANRLASPNALAERATFVGGWALGGGFSGTCPSGSSQCAISDGTCCPTGSICTSQGNFGGVACCPSAANCGAVIKAIPTCADPTWVLYKARGSYFCCQPGQIGVINVASNIVLIVGLCVPGDQSVPSSNLATLAISTTTSQSTAKSSSTTQIISKTSAVTTITTATTATAATAATAATVATIATTDFATTTSPTAPSSTSVTTTASATKNAAAANMISIGGILGFLGSSVFQFIL